MEKVNEKEIISPEDRLVAIEKVEQRLLKRKHTYHTIVGLLVCVLLLLMLNVMLIYTRCGR